MQLIKRPNPLQMNDMYVTEHMIYSTNKHIRLQASLSTKLTAEQLKALFYDEDAEIRANIVVRYDFPEDLKVAASNDPNKIVRYCFANQVNYTTGVYRSLRKVISSMSFPHRLFVRL